jgi:hypothetical protein
VSGEFALHTEIISLWVPGPMKPNNSEEEKRKPPHEQQQHEPVTKLKEVVDQITMLRSIGHHAHPFIKHFI